jgi:NADH-quinone oxidoreductase subunit J
MTLFAQSAIADGSPGFTHTPLFWALILGSFGLWLLLPAGATPVRALGALAGGFGLVMLFLAAPLAGWSADETWSESAPKLAVAALSLLTIAAALGAAFSRGKLFVVLAICAAVLWIAALAGIAALEVSPPLRIILTIAFSLAGVALYFPGARRRQRAVGLLLSALALGLVASLAPGLGDDVEQVLFGVLATVVAVSAVATISMRSPVYAAIWFAVTLLTTGGLLLLEGAAFLGVATVVVYAGAILVTFLFVLMLAQPEGHAYYDRISWGTYAVFVAAIAGMAIIGGLTYRLMELDGTAAAAVVERQPPANEETRPGGEKHMVGMGGALFGRHLIAVEAAGVLLLAALVGAASINLARKEETPATNNRQPATAP